ncbi:MAG: 50S ribosomal protein L17 [Deltaproteobacteria bacterium]|jgi:large subunit ribosomal protein L17|nr:50S ribosomal protein L17 [Deltaproteobacteria bacterium]
MRHSNAGKKFSRTPSHRKALLHNLAKALLSHGRIRTTEAKAKELRGVVEPLITLALRDDLHARRQAYRVLGSHALVKRLFDEIAPVFAGVPGGYTRVVKLAQPRRGDNAPLALIELIRKPGEQAAPVQEAKPAKAAQASKKAVKPAKAAVRATVKASPAEASAPAEGAEAPAKPGRTRKKAEPTPESE